MPLAMQYLAKFPQPISLGALAGHPDLQDLVQSILIDQRNHRDPFYAYADAYLSSHENSEFNLVRRMVQVLYRIGAVGIKRSPEDKVHYSHTDMPIVVDEELTEDSTIRFHQMFLLALKGNFALQKLGQSATPHIIRLSLIVT